MIWDCCNQTPEWTKSCCSGRLAMPVVLWESAVMIKLKRLLYSKVSLLQFFSLSWPTIMSQTRQNPLWVEHTRISGIRFLLVSPCNSSDNRSLLSCKLTAESLWEELKSHCPLSSEASWEASRIIQFLPILLPRNKDLTGLQIITHFATTCDEKFLCYNNLYVLIKGENSTSMGIHDQILAIK